MGRGRVVGLEMSSSVRAVAERTSFARQASSAPYGSAHVLGLRTPEPVLLAQVSSTLRKTVSSARRISPATVASRVVIAVNAGRRDNPAG